MRNYRIALLGLCTFALLMSIFTLVSNSAAHLPPFTHTVYTKALPASPQPNPMRSYGQVVEDMDHWVLAYEMSQAQAAYQAAAAAQARQQAAQTAHSGILPYRCAPQPCGAPQPVPSPGCGYPSVPGALQGCMWQCIEMAESTDTPTDHSGLYGDLDSTWNHYGGFPYAGAAPISVQNDFNLALYNSSGWRPWNDHCTGT